MASNGKYGSSLSAVICCCLFSTQVWAQTGVDDDRVSLPEGPGSLEGVGENVELSGNMGAMMYGINIATPTGRNGLSPNLRLDYSSSAAVGALGIGWSMEMPTIERMTSRGIPEYDAEDLFAADGSMELVEVSSQGDERVYRERFEKSFKRYTWKSIGDGEQGYWVVESPDGIRSYYGATSEGTLEGSARHGGDLGTAIYHLVERVDPFGNRIRYSYDSQGGTKPLLAAIDYLFVDGEPEYSVAFTYEERPDPIIDCGMGFEDTLAHRVLGIAITHAGQTIREVRLGYEEPDGGSLMSRLSEVRQWGIGGRQRGMEDPILHSFDYQKGLGATCTSDCELPYMVDMGTIPGGASIASEQTTLIDINGDALPDILDTSQPGAHRFFLNEMSYDAGAYPQSFSSARSSSVGDSTFTLGSKVQIMDLNGDGFSDLVNTDTGGFLLKDPDSVDWLPGGSNIDVDELKTIDFANARFFDQDMDRRIDILLSVGGTTQLLINGEGGFTRESAEPIGKGFVDANLQLADMNGDGMNDVVEFTQAGTLQYRLNLGRGNWSEWRSYSSIAIAESKRGFAELEDLNGDGRDDVVIVGATQIEYALNRGDSFGGFITLSSAQINGDIPERTDGTRVLYADMNGNGSEDIVWFDSSSGVRYLELFPQRANLISTITNGIGMVQKVTYGTSVQQMVRARDVENKAWSRALQMPMPVVESIDIYATLTGSADGSGLHEIKERTYRDAYYDGAEKQFRGFETVLEHTPGDAYQQSYDRFQRFDVGEASVHRKNLLLEEEVLTEGVVIVKMTHEHDFCELDGLPPSTTLETATRKVVKFVCKVSQRDEIIEGMPEASITRQTDYAYDGFGNITREVKQGDIARTGDEMTTTRVFATPNSDRWMLRLPVEERMYRDEDGEHSITRYFYDGDDYTGLASGSYSHGFLSRQTVAVDATRTIDRVRQRRDDFGNVVEIITPNGSVDEPSAHRRLYTYDSTGRFVVGTTIKAGDYDLYRESRYDSLHQKPIYMTDWILVEDGEERSSRHETTVVYDGLGRLSKRFEPGDSDPSAEYTYTLGDPISRIEVAMRTERDGAQDQESILCLDGRGRQYQQRTELSSGLYQVSGFSIFNSRGADVEVFQPYESSSADCEIEAPAGVLSVQKSFDALFRPLTVTMPDAEMFDGQASMKQLVYEPLTIKEYDEEDSDEASAFHDTPLIVTMDGLERLVSLTRTGLDASIDYRLHYDNTGSFSGYTDPEGNRHEMTVDLAGRVTEIINPNTGKVTIAYDDADREISRADARGITVLSAYDAIDRRVEQWEQGAREATLVTWSYDRDEDCALEVCTNAVGRLASVSHKMNVDDVLLEAKREYGYDNRGRNVMARRVWDRAEMSWTRRYDNLNRLTSSTYPHGHAHEMGYDALGRLTSLAPFIDGVGYDDRGLLDVLEYANLATTTRTFDANMRLASLSHEDGTGATIEALLFHRDRVGNLTRLEDFAERDDIPSNETAYTYDAFYRVSSASFGGGREDLTYGYDVLDNLTSLTSSLGEASAAHVGDLTYDGARPNTLATAGDTTYAYDEAGHMVERGEQSLSWEHRGWLESVASTSGAGEKHYVYGPDQVPVLRYGEDGFTLFGEDNLEVRDGVIVTYAKVGDWRVGRHTSTEMMTSFFADLAPAGAVDGKITAADAFALVLEESPQAPFALGASQERVLGGAAARMLAEASDALSFLHSDHLGSITAATNEGGELSGQRAFYPAGLVRWSQGDVDRYGFTGQEHTDAGTIRFQYRHLDPRTGRWASFDPNFMALAGEQMRSLGEATTGYAYVANNFSNKIDPLGLTIKNDKKSDKKDGKQEKSTNKKKMTSEQKKQQKAEIKKLDQMKANYAAWEKANTVKAPTDRWGKPTAYKGGRYNRMKLNTKNPKNKIAALSAVAVLGILGVAVAINPFDGNDDASSEQAPEPTPDPGADTDTDTTTDPNTNTSQ